MTTRSKVQDTTQYLNNMAWDDQNNLPMSEVVYSPDGGVTINRLVIDGNGALTATIDESTLATSANQTNGNQQTKITDGTNVANVLAGDSGQNSQLVNGSRKEVTFTTASVQAVATTDVSNYSHVSVHILTQGTSSTVTFQSSNDGSTWVSTVLQNTSATATGVVTNSAVANTIYVGNLPGRYFRLNVTGISAGTTSGTIEFTSGKTHSFPTIFASSAQSGTWNVGASSATGSAVPANAFYIGANNGTSLQGLNTLPNVSDAVGGSGSLSVGPMLFNGTTWDRSYAVNGKGDATTGLGVEAVGSWSFNGTNWDRTRGNEDVSLLASAARTTTQTSADLVNYNGKSALIVALDVTSAGTGNITLSIDRKDTVSGKYVNILTGAAVTTNSTNVYKVGPDIAAVANSIAQDYLSRTFRIVVTANNANSMTYSVGYSLVR